MYKINVNYNLITFKIIGMVNNGKLANPRGFCNLYAEEDKKRSSEDSMIDIFT